MPLYRTAQEGSPDDVVERAKDLTDGLSDNLCQPFRGMRA
jgi:hypothetical protein